MSSQPSNMQLAGLTVRDLPSDIGCDGDGCDAWIDTAEVGHPENAGWLHRIVGPPRAERAENYCPRCRIGVETEQQTLAEIQP